MKTDSDAQPKGKECQWAKIAFADTLLAVLDDQPAGLQDGNRYLAIMRQVPWVNPSQAQKTRQQEAYWRVVVQLHLGTVKRSS